ncbi:hypothetical protein [Methylovulum psychrotolerans]|uniref:Mobilization protein n=1 Tax=Methylovulum psychrotolerans TaxID=1704499 RepID=A0A2S5CFU4_9GAMM|nr:hypothetical protein [Methylovulum psychrotolerans]POZ49676.1 hypothetical protein AADEFJLK_04542 [Methylovulum psychrotolerans]
MLVKIEQQREALRKQIEALKKKEQLLVAKQNSEARKLDTRRKILIGAAVMAHCEHDEKFADLVRSAVKNNITKEKDKEVLNSWLTGGNQQPQPEVKENPTP